MEVEPASAAVINEPRHVLLARVAVPRYTPGWLEEELERAFGVERVGQRRRREGAVVVEIVVARGALVPRTYAGFLAPVALERDLRVLELQLVLGVAHVGYLIVFHCVFFFFYLCFLWAIIRKCLVEDIYIVGWVSLLLDG